MLGNLMQSVRQPSQHRQGNVSPAGIGGAMRQGAMRSGPMHPALNMLPGQARPNFRPPMQQVQQRPMPHPQFPMGQPFAGSRFTPPPAPIQGPAAAPGTNLFRPAQAAQFGQQMGTPAPTNPFMSSILPGGSTGVVPQGPPQNTGIMSPGLRFGGFRPM